MSPSYFKPPPAISIFGGDNFISDFDKRCITVPIIGEPLIRSHDSGHERLYDYVMYVCFT